MRLPALTTLLLLLPIVALARPLRVSIYDFSPHMIKTEESALPKGPAISFIEDSLKKEPIQWNHSPFSRVMLDLENGKSDLGLLIAKTPEREKKLRFSKTPLFKTSSAIIVPRNSALAKAKSLKSFSGLTLGHSQDSVRPEFLNSYNIKIDALSGENVIERNLHRLRSGRLDGVFVPTASNGQAVLKQLKMDREFAIFIIPETTLDLYVAFRKDIDDDVFKQVNEYLRTHREQYSRLLYQSP